MSGYWTLNKHCHNYENQYTRNKAFLINPKNSKFSNLSELYFKLKFYKNLVKINERINLLERIQATILKIKSFALKKKETKISPPECIPTSTIVELYYVFLKIKDFV